MGETLHADLPLHRRPHSAGRTLCTRSSGTTGGRSQGPGAAQPPGPKGSGPRDFRPGRGFLPGTLRSACPRSPPDQEHVTSGGTGGLPVGVRLPAAWGALLLRLFWGVLGSGFPGVAAGTPLLSSAPFVPGRCVVVLGPPPGRRPVGGYQGLIAKQRERALRPQTSGRLRVPASESAL